MLGIWPWMAVNWNFCELYSFLYLICSAAFGSSMGLHFDICSHDPSSKENGPLLSQLFCFHRQRGQRSFVLNWPQIAHILQVIRYLALIGQGLNILRSMLDSYFLRFILVINYCATIITLLLFIIRNHRDFDKYKRWLVTVAC